MVAALRREDVLSQRAFASALGFGAGTIAWIESGRSTASSAQVWRIEQELIEAAILSRPGQVFEIINEVIVALVQRGLVVTLEAVEGDVDRGDVAQLDRIVAAVLQAWIDRERQTEGG